MKDSIAGLWLTYFRLTGNASSSKLSLTLASCFLPSHRIWRCFETSCFINFILSRWKESCLVSFVEVPHFWCVGQMIFSKVQPPVVFVVTELFRIKRTGRMTGNHNTFWKKFHMFEMESAFVAALKFSGNIDIRKNVLYCFHIIPFSCNSINYGFYRFWTEQILFA